MGDSKIIGCFALNAGLAAVREITGDLEHWLHLMLIASQITVAAVTVIWIWQKIKALRKKPKCTKKHR